MKHKTKRPAKRKASVWNYTDADALPVAPRKKRRPQQQLLPVCDPRVEYATWREGIGKHLLERKGRVAALARKLEVTDNVVSDWFTLRRTDPPGWVVHWAHTPEAITWLTSVA